MSATKKQRVQASGKSRGVASVRFRDDHLKVIRGLLAEDHDVREGRMFGYPAFFAGRRMFACIYGDGVGLKVPPTLVARLIECGEAIAFRPHGKPTMREWVQINRSSSSDYVADLDLFLAAKLFVSVDGDEGARP